MKKFRIKHHLTQKQLADMMGFCRSTYSCWELGIRHPSIRNRIKIFWFFIKFYLKMFHVK